MSPATLETLIELGVRYTILAPEQIAAVRALGARRVDGRSTATRWTPGARYRWRHRDGSGRTIAIGVFDGPLSRAVAFGETANRAESLLDAVQASADRSQRRRASGWCCARPTASCGGTTRSSPT